jgi:hypothetical protein
LGEKKWEREEVGAEASQNTERTCRRDAWKWAVGREEVVIAAATLFLSRSFPHPSPLHPSTFSSS